MFGRYSLAVFLIMMYAMFTVNASGGAAAAQDDAVDFEEERDELVANLTESQHSATQNYTTTEKQVAGPIVNVTFAASKKVVYHSMNVGASSPLLANVNAALAPWVLIGLLLWHVRRVIKMARS